MAKYESKNVSAINIEEVQKLIQDGWTISSYTTYVDDDCFHMIENDNYDEEAGEDYESISAELDSGLVTYTMKREIKSYHEIYSCIENVRKDALHKLHNECVLGINDLLRGRTENVKVYGINISVGGNSRISVHDCYIDALTLKLHYTIRQHSDDDGEYSTLLFHVETGMLTIIFDQLKSK